MSSRGSELVVALLAAVLVACGGDVRTIEVCGRGDRAELAAALAGGQLEITILDADGTAIAEARVPAGGARAALRIDDGHAVRVTGRGADGALRAEGEAALDGGDVCVCLALAGQTAACAGLTCRVAADRCELVDESGAIAGSRELVLDAADTTLVAATPEQAHGGDPALRVTQGAEVALLRFDTRVLPRTSVIEEATLAIAALPPPAAPSGIPIVVVPVLEAWDEATATWSARASGAAWTSPGCGAGSCGDEPWAAVDVDHAAQAYRVLLGRRVAGWVSGAEANHGMALVGGGGETALWSREGQDQGAPPRLVIRYHMADDGLAPPVEGAICGNGIAEAGEGCDDGDRDDRDACTNACQPARCGDGVTRRGVEDCDDGNAVNDDGCTARCLRCADPNAAATFIDGDGRCYARYPTARNYGVAENACTEAGHGSLAVFETRAEQNAVLAGLGSPDRPTWIGLSDRNVEGTFAWATGAVPAFDGFAAGEPAVPPASADEDCVAVANGAWADLPCGQLHGYLCERAGWSIDADGRAWLPVLGPTTDWDGAQLDCLTLGAHLAVPGTDEENARLHALVGVPVWIGLAEKAREGALTWITGEPVGATHFAAAPELGPGTFCTKLGTDGLWSVSPCDARSRYVCEAE
jgi:cysteine-rich repeat protein